jgi:hypothetical protein
MVVVFKNNKARGPVAKKPFPKMQCPKCGAEADAACRCGVGYMPMSEIAKLAVEKDPTKSDVAIAKKTGFSRTTIRRARQHGQNGHVDEGPRTGLDGRTRKCPPEKR